MSISSPTVHEAVIDDSPRPEADTAAVLAGLVSGAALDPNVAARVRTRAARITDAIRRARGLVDDAAFQSLLDEDA